MAEKKEVGFAERMLTSFWQYKMPPRWVVFVFVLQFIASVALLFATLGLYAAAVMIYVFPPLIAFNVIFLYIWLVATGRTEFKLRTASEARSALPTHYFYASGLSLAAAAVVIAIGEHALRAATGYRNVYSGDLAVTCPTTFVAGLFNLALASRRRTASRIFTAIVLAVNGLLAAFMYFYMWGNLYFADNSDIDKSDLISLDMGPLRSWTGKSFPPQPLTFYHTLRVLPSGICILVPITTFCILFHALFKVSLFETTQKETKFEKRTRSWLLGVLGLLTFLSSFLVMAMSSRLIIMTSINHSLFSTANMYLGTVLAATGLLATSMFRRSAPGSSSATKTGLMLLAALALVLGYSVVDEADDFQRASVAAHASLVGGPAVSGICWKKTNITTVVPEGQVCFRLANKNVEEAPEASYGRPSYGPPPSTGYEEEDDGYLAQAAEAFESLTESDDTGYGYGYSSGAPSPSYGPQDDDNDEEKAAEAEEDDKETLLCIPKEKICDGVVDVIKAVKVCREDDWGGQSSVVVPTFADEVDCLTGDVSSSLAWLKASAALSMLLSLAVFARVAFFVGGDRSEEEEGSDRDVDDNSTCLPVSNIKDRLESTVRERLSSTKTMETGSIC